MRLAITNVVGTMIKTPITVTTAGETEPMPEAGPGECGKRGATANSQNQGEDHHGPPR
jgi:hypothetical protein